MKTSSKAFIFDLNGTMIDDMDFHTDAWRQILRDDLRKEMSREEVKGHMYGKNSEVLERIFGKGYFTDTQMKSISIEKEKRYQWAYLPHLKLLDGLATFMERAEKQGIPMAIGSAAIPFNIDFVLDTLNIRRYFKAVVSADDVTESKPHPATFLQAAAQLGVDPSGCTVFEDAPKGVEAAQRAGMNCVVLTTTHAREEFSSYHNVHAFVQNYIDPALEGLFR
jgi:beta-phosphoglucomutase family hydrolase